MSKVASNFRLPLFPIIAKLFFKLALGIPLLVVLLGYQPTLAFPPIKKALVRAQVEQQQVIKAETVPLVFQLPHPCYLTTRFSVYHPGVDLATGLGMPIKPVASGTIIDAGYNFWGLGLIVVIDHGFGFQSLYAHMGKIYIKKGDKVNQTDFLGEVGLTGHTTGPHTHFELTKDGERIDPLPLLPQIDELPIVRNTSDSAKQS